MTNSDDVSLRTREASPLLGRTEGTLRNWRYQGKGPRYIQPPEGGVRYRLSDLLAWLDSNTVTPKPVAPQPTRSTESR